MTNSEQRVLLNGQTSKWTNILSRAPQGSVLGLLLFLIYMNDLTDDLKSKCKIFADDMSLFSKINDIDASNIGISNDLVKTSKWAFQCKISFNLDISKQATEDIFLKSVKNLCLHRFFSTRTMTSPCQKQLGLVVNSKPSFN